MNMIRKITVCLLIIVVVGSVAAASSVNRMPVDTIVPLKATLAVYDPLKYGAVFYGLSAANGNIFLALQDGTIICIGAK